ncbi:hypothetical protein RND81_04G170900 [Saponaria officinalis]|uniref:Peptidase A1 domain-containing protein n=1 Tax=Saponaria officinalis TaxID=3572 RepID=A0AAW1LIJ7_SAPOF
MTKTLLTYFLLIALFLISNTNELSLKIIPIDSPHLNIVPRNLTFKERHQLLANISILRGYSYRNDFEGLHLSLYESQIFKFKAGYYVTKLVFGSGQQPYAPYVLVDTGSDETWVQCEGCNPCFELRGNNFAYHLSRSYRRMSLDDNLCLPPRQQFEGACRFHIPYISSSTTGFLGRDSFFYKNSLTGNIDMYPNIAFGCGIENVNIVFWGNRGPQNVIAGVHGLAMGPRSFINQLSAQTQGRFSYCLPSAAGGNRVAQSTIYFGDEAQISGDVKMISMYAMGRYHLYLGGISVDGERVDIDLSFFMLDERRRTRGFFVDSGAHYSLLPRSVYDPLKMAVATYFFNNYGWRPGSSVNPFDLCYAEYPSDGQSFPIVTLHFLLLGHSGEVDMDLRSEHMFQSLNNRRRFCMAVISGNDPGPSLLGAFQQKNFKFLFDAYNGLFYFVPQFCQEN